MAQVTLTPATAGQVESAAFYNANLNAIVNQVNGNLDATNLAALAVTAAKIATGAVTGTKIAMGSDAQGDILIRGASNYERLGAGTSGQFLKTQGAGANPIWDYGTLLQAPVVVIDSSYQTTATTVGAKDAAFPNTEGGQFLSASITPKSGSSNLIFLVIGYWQENTNTGSFAKVGLFQGGVTNAIAMGWVDATAGGGGNATNVTAFIHKMASPGTSSVTFTVRAGCDVGQCDMNGYNGGRAGGGVLNSALIILETL